MRSALPWYLLALFVSCPAFAAPPDLEPLPPLAVVDQRGDVVVTDVPPDAVLQGEVDVFLDFGEAKRMWLTVDLRSGRWTRTPPTADRYYAGAACTGTEYIMVPRNWNDMAVFVDDAGTVWAGRVEFPQLASYRWSGVCTNVSGTLYVRSAVIAPVMNILEFHPEPLRATFLERRRAAAH